MPAHVSRCAPLFDLATCIAPVCDDVAGPPCGDSLFHEGDDVVHSDFGPGYVFRDARNGLALVVFTSLPADAWEEFGHDTLRVCIKHLEHVPGGWRGGPR